MSYEEFKEYIQLNDQLEDNDRDGAYDLYQKYYKVLSSKSLSKWIDKYSSEKSQKVLYYLYTFTLKPDADAVKAENYIVSIANRKENLNIKEFSYCVEHEETNKHFHILIGSTRSIRADAFKQYQQNYGFVHRSRKVSSENIQIVDYITKESTPITLVKDGKSLRVGDVDQ